MRQIEMATSVARVLRVLLTNHKERQQRLATKTSETSITEQVCPDSITESDFALAQKSQGTANLSMVEAVPGISNWQLDEDDLSLKETLPEIIQACRSSRLQLIHLAPRLLEESAHTSNSNVRILTSEAMQQMTLVQVSACASACLHVIQELSLLLENAVLSKNVQRIIPTYCLTIFLQSDGAHGISQDLGVLEEERRWQNLLAQSPSKGDFEFDGADFMM